METARKEMNTETYNEWRDKRKMNRQSEREGEREGGHWGGGGIGGGGVTVTVEEQVQEIDSINQHCLSLGFYAVKKKKKGKKKGESPRHCSDIFLLRPLAPPCPVFPTRLSPGYADGNLSSWCKFGKT